MSKQSDYQRMDAEAIKNYAKLELRQIADKKYSKYVRHFGTFGKYILEAGNGGGFYSVPHAIDIYERALGLSRDETWLIKRLISYLPNVFPSMTTIANQSLGKVGKDGKERPLSDKTVRRIKKSLELKGYIRDNGEVDKARGKMNHVLNIMPFFDAVFLCIICDPKSKVVVGHEINAVREAFTNSTWDGSVESQEWEAKKYDFQDQTLPISINTAKEFARARGLKSLNWQCIESLQNDNSYDELQKVSDDKMRELKIKKAIKDGIGDAFGFTWYKENYAWLKELAATPIRVDEIESLTASYANAPNPNAKDFKRHLSFLIFEYPENKKLLAERAVAQARHDALNAEREATYAE